MAVRTLAEVILADGRDLNHELVRAGMAWWYRKYAKHDSELERLELEAKAARGGHGKTRVLFPLGNGDGKG